MPSTHVAPTVGEEQVSPKAAVPTEHPLTNGFWDVLPHQGTRDGLSSSLQLAHGSLNLNALLYSALIAEFATAEFAFANDYEEQDCNISNEAFV